MGETMKIGLEIHSSLDTESKLFCECAKRGTEDEQPNSRTCPTCLGHPGSKPRTNKKAVDHALTIALGLGCEIAPLLRFSRKSYFYPDLAKNFQITQYEHPLGSSGKVKLSNGREIRITRVHLEEDPAGIIDKENHTLIDYNRSGTPLVEIVTEPDIESPEEARLLVRELRSILQHLGVFANGYDYTKVDANISVKETGFTRVEIKNLLGLKDLQDALTYERERQRDAAKKGEPVQQETRHWDEKTKSTHSMRRKEEEDDYGYIEEPDLVPISIGIEWTARLRGTLPELPLERASRIVDNHKVSAEDAHIICASPVIAEIFDRLAKEVNGVLVAKWLRRDVLAQLDTLGEREAQTHLLGEHTQALKELIALLKLVESATITDTIGKELLEELFTDLAHPLDIARHVKQKGLRSIGAEGGELEILCRQAIERNPSAVADFRSGKVEALNFLLGAVMRESKGKADPGQTKECLKRLLNS